VIEVEDLREDLAREAPLQPAHALVDPVEVATFLQGLRFRVDVLEVFAVVDPRQPRV
jgi:hypothetical protein